MSGSFAGMLERQRSRRRAAAEEQRAAIATLEGRLERYLAGLDREPSHPAGRTPTSCPPDPGDHLSLEPLPAPS